MTDESGTPPESEPTPNAAQSAMETVKQSLSSAERMVAIGALILLIGPYLLGEVVFDEYALSYVEILLTVGALALVYTVKMKSGSVPLPYTFTLKSLSYGVGVIGVAEVLWYIEGNRVDGASVFFALVYFAGVITMVLGGRQLTD